VRILEVPHLGSTCDWSEASRCCRMRYDDVWSGVSKWPCVSRRLAVPVFFGEEAVISRQSCVRIWFWICDNTLKKYSQSAAVFKQ
jgi:hypothetical protein